MGKIFLTNSHVVRLKNGLFYKKFRLVYSSLDAGLPRATTTKPQAILNVLIHLRSRGYSEMLNSWFVIRSIGILN